MKKTTKSKQKSFYLEGEFLGYIWQNDQCKYLQIDTVEGVLVLRIPKKIRLILPMDLAPNQIIQVVGKSKLSKQGKGIKLQVIKLNLKNTTDNIICDQQSTKVKLLICQKSGCQKKGGEEQRQAIEAVLEARGLTKLVIIEESGCLGKCAMAPNIMLMPGKKRLSGMKPEVIADLLIKDKPTNFSY